jgi:hypothetical protein
VNRVTVKFFTRRAAGEALGPTAALMSDAQGNGSVGDR